MKIIAVVGSGSGCGKTTVVCQILRSIPGLGAVKISPRNERIPVEWGAGEPGKDTDRYINSGAALVARITGPRENVVESWKCIEKSFENCIGVVVEGSRSIDLSKDLFVIHVTDDETLINRKIRNTTMALFSDIIIINKTHKKELIAAYQELISHSRKKILIEMMSNTHGCSKISQSTIQKLLEFLFNNKVV